MPPMKRSGHVVLKIKSRRSRYAAVALDDNRTVIAEGVKLDSVIKRANKTGKQFAIVFLTKDGNVL